MDIVELLKQQAQEIAKEGHDGWGNTMTWAAEEIEKLRAAQQSVQPTDETCANCGRPLNGGACAPCFAPSLEDFVSG